jgi:hypothetical protein
LICFRGAILVTRTIFLIVRNWASWNNSPFIMGEIDDEPGLTLSTKIISVTVLESF